MKQNKTEKLTKEMKIILLQLLKQKRITSIDAELLIELFQKAELIPETLNIILVNHGRTK